VVCVVCGVWCVMIEGVHLGICIHDFMWTALYTDLQNTKNCPRHSIAKKDMLLNLLHQKRAQEKKGTVNVKSSMNMSAVCSGVVCGVWYV